MDEVGFHLSRSFETFQVYLYSGTQNACAWLQLCMRNTRSFISSVWSQETFNYIYENVQNFCEGCIHVCQEYWHLLSRQFDHYHLRERITMILENDIQRTSLYFGGFGFLIGGMFGLVVGLAWYRTPLVTQRMKAIVCTGYNGIDSLICADDVPVPTINKADEVLVQVKASSVDSIDIKICSGYGRVLRRQLSQYNYNVRSEFPIILGRDCSGIVAEIGQSVSKLEVGDEVWFAVPYWHPGTMSEYIVVKDKWIAKKPKGIGFDVAASIPYSGAVAWNAVVEQAKLSPKNAMGKRVLVHSGSSPVGCIIIQLAKMWGAKVTATCSLRATPVIQALGVDDVVVFGHGDVEKKLALRERFDIIFNTAGVMTHETCMQYCCAEGFVVSTVTTDISSDHFGFFIGSIYAFWIRVTYYIKKLFSSTMWGTVNLDPSILDRLAALLEDGSLQPVVDKIFAPQDVELAFQHADSDEAIGKTIIRFRQLFMDMGMPMVGPTVMFEDNQGCIHVIKSSSFSARTKHMDVAYHQLHDLQEKKILGAVYCESKSIIADILTKPLAKEVF